MNISGILQQTKVTEVEGKKLTLKKYPLGFMEYLRMKSLEGKSLTYEGRSLKKVESFGVYDASIYADQLYQGLNSWELIDETGYAIELTSEACLTLVEDYPDFAQSIIKEINLFNSPISKETKKK